MAAANAWLKLAGTYYARAHREPVLRPVEPILRDRVHDGLRRHDTEEAHRAQQPAW
jgi:hypothetical protein